MRQDGSLDRNEAGGEALWVAIVSGASVLFSLALACAAPLAAVATVAGACMPVRRAVALTGAAWLANQLVGYLVLGYPTTWDSFAWGAAIGVAAVAAAVAVVAVRGVSGSQWVTLGAGFLAAFVVYEAVLYAATAILPSGDGAFSPAVVAQIFWTNLAALALLLLLHRAALAAGVTSLRLPGHAAAGRA